MKTIEYACPPIWDVYKQMSDSGLLADVRDGLKDLRSQLRERVEGIIDAALRPLFMISDFDDISIFGYTPSFNEGDPCVHKHNALNPDSDQSCSNHFMGMRLLVRIGAMFGGNSTIFLTFQSGKRCFRFCMARTGG